MVGQVGYPDAIEKRVASRFGAHDFGLYLWSVHFFGWTVTLPSLTGLVVCPGAGRMGPRPEFLRTTASMFFSETRCFTLQSPEVQSLFGWPYRVR